jgi:hypothetical protein
MTHDARLEIAVTYDLAKGYYIGMHPELPTPVVALSLAVLCKRVEERLIGEDVDVKLVLDRAARQERDRRRRGGRAENCDSSNSHPPGADPGRAPRGR